MSHTNLIVHRWYGSHGEYQKHAAELSKQGWVVVSVTQDRRNNGSLLGRLALFFKPKPFLVVTYRREFS